MMVLAEFTNSLPLVRHYFFRADGGVSSIGYTREFTVVSLFQSRQTSVWTICGRERLNE